MHDRFVQFDPATLYEAAGQRGMVDPAIRPAWHGAKVCGRAVTVQCPPGDNLMLHIAVANAPPGSIIVATVGGYLSAGAWGEILTEAARTRGIAGLVIDGAVRDIDAIEALRFPVFSRGLAIGSCTKERAGQLDGPIQLGGATVCSGDLIFGNADGVVVIEQRQDRGGLRGGGPAPRSRVRDHHEASRGPDDAGAAGADRSPEHEGDRREVRTAWNHAATGTRTCSSTAAVSWSASTFRRRTPATSPAA